MQGRMRGVLRIIAADDDAEGNSSASKLLIITSDYRSSRGGILNARVKTKTKT